MKRNLHVLQLFIAARVASIASLIMVVSLSTLRMDTPHPSPPPAPSALSRSGFTLIELSIVLVVIGLIVGGILIGQSLIAAATIRAQITQIDRYNTAANTFFIKYGGLPGDLQLNLANQFGFQTGSCDASYGKRDGNGAITNVAIYPLAQNGDETGLFWQDLAYVNMIDFTPLSVSCASQPDTPLASIRFYFPPAKIGNSNSLYVYNYSGYNWFGVSAITRIGANIIYGYPALSVSQAYSIDAKIDDGLPSTGWVQAVYINGSQTATTTAANASSDSATTCYNTSTTSGVYSIAYQAGAQINCALSFMMQAED